MKKQERYKLLHIAKDQYSKTFNLDYQFKCLTRKELHNLLNQHTHSSMCEWDYCCYGLYQNCWQDPYAEGMWDMTQEEVDKFIANIIDDYARHYRKDSRILCCESDNAVHVILVMRDICTTDFLITFTDKED